MYFFKIASLLIFLMLSWAHATETNRPCTVALGDSLKTTKKMPVFFRSEMNVKEIVSVFSPSAGKPESVVADWVKSELPVEVISPAPLTKEELTLAHDSKFVEGVLAGTVENGFGNTSEEVIRSLPYLAGSVYHAAVYVLKNGGNAWSPVSGSHHALFDRAAKFCTFNHVMISTLLLKKNGLVRKVGIIDNDMHFSDGDRDIIKRLKLDWINHYSFGEDNVYKDSVRSYLKRLPKIVESMKDVDIIFYNAGVDPHIDDPLGGVLTTEQMRERDHIVYNEIRKLGKPVVSLLAGGYRKDRKTKSIQPVLDSHRDTFLESLRLLE